MLEFCHLLHLPLLLLPLLPLFRVARQVSAPFVEGYVPLLRAPPPPPSQPRHGQRCSDILRTKGFFLWFLKFNVASLASLLLLLSGQVSFPKWRQGMAKKLRKIKWTLNQGFNGKSLQNIINLPWIRLFYKNMGI